MSVIHMPATYRRPALSTMGYFMQNLQPLLQMYVQHTMQKDMLSKQVDIDKTRVDAVNKEWDRRFAKQKGAEGQSLAKTLYDEYGLIRAGKGFAKIKNGKVSMVTPPEADNIKNRKLGEWIADKTLIPVDAKYPAGDPSFKFQDKNYYFNPKRGEGKKEPSILEQARKAFVSGKASPEQIRLLGKEKKVLDKPTPEYKPGQALEKIAAAGRAKASFNKTGKIDAIMAKMFPEYKEGQTITTREVQKVNKAYDKLISHLKKFAPKPETARDDAIKRLQAAGQPITEKNIIYIMDQL